MTAARFILPACTVILAAALPLTAVARGGQVTTDGSVGAAHPLAGPNFSVTADLGRQMGPNLFHSFSQFNLSAGEVATFSGPASVNQVLARVTGGSASSVDGTIRCTIPNANFYLINPAGVVFGPHAALDLSGSFVVSTSGAVRLADGGVFNAASPAGDVLSSAPPAAFGFLSAPPAPVSVGASGGAAAHLATPAGQSLSIVAGPIQIVNGHLQATAGRINIVSVGGAGDVQLDPSKGSAVQVQTSATGGSVVLASGAEIDADGAPGGRVVVRTGSLSLDGSAVHANNLGAGPGGGVAIAADQITLSNSFVNAQAAGEGAGGDVSVSSSNLTIGANSVISTQSQVGPGGNLTAVVTGGLTIDGRTSAPHTLTGLSAQTAGAGPGGNLKVSAGTIQIFGGGSIDTTTFGAGAGGSATVTCAGAATLDGTGTPAGSITGISSQTQGSGPGGNLTLQAGSLQVLHGASANVFAFRSGNAGALNVTAPDIVLDGHASSTGVTTGITANNLGAGSGGDISIAAGTIQILNAAQVSAATSGTGRGGNIAIDAASSLSLDEPEGGPTTLTAITVATSGGAGGGAGGDILIHTPLLSLKGGANIDAEVSSSGRGGDITLNADRLTLSGTAQAQPQTIFNIVAVSASGKTVTLPVANTTEITTAAISFNGPAGNIRINANTLEVTTGAFISASTFDKASGGNIDIQAQNIFLSQAPAAFATGIFGVTLAPGGGNGGNISVRGGTVTVAGGGLIDADTFGAGAGGNVAVRARTVLLEGSGVDQLCGIGAQTNAATGGGAGGSLQIEAARLTLTNGAIAAAGTLGSGGGGNVSVVAGNLRIGSGSLLASSSQGSGNAGTVSIQAGQVVALTGRGAIAASSDFSDAGTVTIDAGQTLSLTGGSVITARAAGDGGNVHLIAARRISLDGSQITGRAGGNGGSIILDPPAVALRDSIIDGRSGGLAVAVSITSDLFLLSTSRILTNTGRSFPETDIAGAIAPLRGVLLSNGVGLEPQCGQLYGGAFSSFIVTGRGGVAPEPEGWIPSLDLRPVQADGGGR